MWPWDRRGENNNLLITGKRDAFARKSPAGRTLCSDQTSNTKRWREEAAAIRCVLLVLKGTTHSTVNPPPLFRLCLWCEVVRCGTAAQTETLPLLSLRKTLQARRHRGGWEEEEEEWTGSKLSDDSDLCFRAEQKFAVWNLLSLWI